MRAFPIRLALAVVTLTGGSCANTALPRPSPDRFDRALFREPPADLGPHIRWWWPGGAVDDATIADEVAQVASAGFAGIEQQTLVFGMSAADVAADPRIRTVGSPDELAHVRTFVREAHARGLVASITLGSGWPSGGTFSTDVRPEELLFRRIDVTGPVDVDVPIPPPEQPSWVDQSNWLFPVIGTFDPASTLLAVIEAPWIDASSTPPTLGQPVDVTASVTGTSFRRSIPSGDHALFFVYRHTVDHVVAGAAFPGAAVDAKVVDALHPRGSTAWITEQVEPWLMALAPEVPDEVFVDSFEFVSELPWARDFDQAFALSKGYPLLLDLPFVLRAEGEAKYVEILRGASRPAYASMDDRGARAREDYEDVRAARFREAFLSPVHAAATANGTALRLQAHGGYAHVLDGYLEADVPESEGLFAKGSMDFLQLAASAAHVAGQTTVSSESFVVIDPPGTALSEDERWMLAGRAYVAGVNRLVFHGLAYPHVRANGERWHPFRPDASAGVVTAGPFQITSDVRFQEPEWSGLAAFNLALTRLSYAMTRGSDRAEVAWLLDEREIPDASFLRFGELPPEQGESATSLSLRRAGYGYDRISPSMLANATVVAGRLRVGAATFDALLLDDWPSAAPAELAAVTAALDGGVPVVVRGNLPTRARGLADAATRDAAIATAVAGMASRVVHASTDDALPGALAGAGVLPSLGIRDTTCPLVSIAHREAVNADVFLLFDEHPDACTATLDVRGGGSAAWLLDPLTGSARRQPSATQVSVSLAARRPLVLVVERP